MSSDTEWAGGIRPPFTVRNNPDLHDFFFRLRDEIPDYLFPTLIGWTIDHYSQRYIDGVRIDRSSLQKLERITSQQVLPEEHRSSIDAFVKILKDNYRLHINAIDLALGWAKERAVNRLTSYLDEARSVYCVAEDTDGNKELQFRQSKEMRELVETEAAYSDRSSHHLRAAWSKCFGLDPDLNEACFEAVKAIEVALKPVVTPDDPAATLGKMCSAMKDKPSKWETLSESGRGVETVLAMMEMVWQGHLRHGDENAPMEVSQDAAAMTVQTAVLLVSWFRSERIRMKP